MLLQGFDSAKCFFINGTAVWFGPDLSCKPIDCGAPHQILHGFQVDTSTLQMVDYYAPLYSRMEAAHTTDAKWVINVSLASLSLDTSQ